MPRSNVERLAERLLERRAEVGRERLPAGLRDPHDHDRDQVPDVEDVRRDLVELRGAVGHDVPLARVDDARLEREYTSGNGMGVGIDPSARQVAVDDGGFQRAHLESPSGVHAAERFRAYTPRVPPV
jgi:hypothetical protein